MKPSISETESSISSRVDIRLVPLSPRGSPIFLDRFASEHGEGLLPSGSPELELKKKGPGEMVQKIPRSETTNTDAT